jgi:hypothetical protein
MEALQSKSDPEYADVGGSEHWVGWAAVDQALRVLLHKPVVANENVPNRTFTKTNINTINIHASDSTWYGVNFEADYKKLWGK